MSFSGLGASGPEGLAVKLALNSNIVIVTAAGNDAVNLDVICNRFPACHDSRQIVVGYNSPNSNTGKIVDVITSGYAIDSYGADHRLVTGSSFAAPRIVALVASNLNTFKNKLKENSK